jgi:hypothetical protein
MFMGKFSHFVLASALVAGLPNGATLPLAAQERVVPRIEASWRHDRSGLTFAESHAGFTRGDSKQYDKEGYNIGIAFRDPETGTWADLFIYRATPASVAVWGDRAAVGMFANPMLGDVDLAAVRVSRFTPPNGAGENSGVRIVTPTKGELSASGLALYLHDGWLVKLRMSSRQLDATALDARMVKFVSSLVLPPSTRPALPFAEIEDCEAPLKPGKKAKLLRLDLMGSILLGGTLSAAHDDTLEQAEKQAAEQGDKAPWCRDPASQPQYGIYRLGGSEDSYLIALGDTGTSLSVGSYNLGPLLKPGRGFLVTQSDGVTDSIFPPFDRLPSPEQALGLPGNIAPVFSAGLLPENKGSTISVPSP